MVLNTGFTVAPNKHVKFKLSNWRTLSMSDLAGITKTDWPSPDGPFRTSSLDSKNIKPLFDKVRASEPTFGQNVNRNFVSCQLQTVPAFIITRVV